MKTIHSENSPNLKYYHFTSHNTCFVKWSILYRLTPILLQRYIGSHKGHKTNHVVIGAITYGTFMAQLWVHGTFMRFQAISQKLDYILVIFHLSKHHSSLSCYMSVILTGQRPDPQQCWKPFVGPIFTIFEAILMQLTPFWMVYNRFCYLNFNAMQRSKISIWNPNLKIGTFTTLVKVRVKVLDTRYHSQFAKTIWPW